MPLAIHKYCSDERKRNDILKRQQNMLYEYVQTKISHIKGHFFLSENYKMFKAFIS